MIFQGKILTYYKVFLKREIDLVVHVASVTNLPYLKLLKLNILHTLPRQ